MVWAVELDGTNITIAVEEGPLVSASDVGKEALAFEIGEGLGNDWLVLAASALYSHHEGRGVAAGTQSSG